MITVVVRLTNKCEGRAGGSREVNPGASGAVAAHRSSRSSNSRSQDSGGVRVVVHAPRIELEAQQHGNEHDRTRQARHPLEHITHRDEPERAQSDEDDTQRHRRSRPLQRGLPLVMTKAHPRNHGHRQIDGEHQGGEIGSLSEQVWIAEERSSPEEREGQDRTPSAHHQAHLNVVPEEVSHLAKERARWCTFRGSRGHGDHLLFLEDRKGSTVAGPPFVTNLTYHLYPEGARHRLIIHHGYNGLLFLLLFAALGTLSFKPP